MCLIAFAIGLSPDWPLVIAANRDELLSRPTLPLARWTSAKGQPIVSGRDLLAGGTWLGATAGGRIAFLTNVRQGQITGRPAARSRGELVTRWLEADSDTASFAVHLMSEAGEYGGFNLVLGDFRQSDWLWVSNRTGNDSPGWQTRSLAQGIYGLSNAALDTPWPKTVELKRALELTLESLPQPVDFDAVRTPLWRALESRRRNIGSETLATGVWRLKEEALSSVFVDFPENGYGTRSSTLLLIRPMHGDLANDVWQVQIQERCHVAGKVQGDRPMFESFEMDFTLD